MDESNSTVVQLANLAKEINSDIRADWSKINVSEDDAYMLMADNVYKQFDAMQDDSEATVVALATIVKLLVENLILRSQIGNNV